MVWEIKELSRADNSQLKVTVRTNRHLAESVAINWLRFGATAVMVVYPNGDKVVMKNNQHRT